jgi:hypothetical protein
MDKSKKTIWQIITRGFMNRQQSLTLDTWCVTKHSYFVRVCDCTFWWGWPPVSKVGITPCFLSNRLAEWMCPEIDWRHVNRVTVCRATTQKQEQDHRRPSATMLTCLPPASTGLHPHYSVEQSTSSEADGCSVCECLPCLLWNHMFITVFTTARL